MCSNLFFSNENVRLWMLSELSGRHRISDFRCFSHRNSVEIMTNPLFLPWELGNGRKRELAFLQACYWHGIFYKHSLSLIDIMRKHKWIQLQARIWLFFCPSYRQKIAPSAYVSTGHLCNIIVSNFYFKKKYFFTTAKHDNLKIVFHSWHPPLLPIFSSSARYRTPTGPFLGGFLLSI